MMGTTIRVGERWTALTATVLHMWSTLPTAQSARPSGVSLSNVEADTCDYCVRHVSGQPRSAR